MLNQQTPLQIDRDLDGFLKVHSIFETIQGEGPFTGWPALFIRLYGCNLQCPFCDTEYTQYAENTHPMHLAQDVQSMFVGRDLSRSLVVITGGEPFRQNLKHLLDFLLALGILVQIETNGVLDPGDDFPWGAEGLTVIVSPKTGKIHHTVAAKADAFKYVMGHDGVAEDGLPISALGHPLGKFPHVARPPEDRPDVPIYLNPMDNQNDKINALNLMAVAESVVKHRKYIMGVQLHKLIGLP